jgi:HAD superfamily hydrolase (TIGR01509 family)
MKTILVDAWNTFFTADGIYQEMFEMLESYSNPKIIVTNANDEQLVEFGINKSPYKVFTLKHNPDKIDSAFFYTLFKEFGLNNKNVLYFEHNLDAVKSAQSVGITTFHYDKDKKDLVALKQFLDVNI